MGGFAEIEDDDDDGKEKFDEKHVLISALRSFHFRLAKELGTIHSPSLLFFIFIYQLLRVLIKMQHLMILVIPIQFPFF